MKLKELEYHLSSIVPFQQPNYNLEQYPTSAHLAARVMHVADQTFDDIEDKAVGDFGCGTGMFAIASQILGAEYSLGLDIDPNALEIALKNQAEFETEVDFLNCDLRNIDSTKKRLDTVIMNPPFGTRVKGIDIVFLKKALEIASSAVYSMYAIIMTISIFFLENFVPNKFLKIFEIISTIHA